MSTIEEFADIIAASDYSKDVIDRILQAVKATTAPTAKPAPFCATHTDFPCKISIWNIAVVGAISALIGLLMVGFLNKRVSFFLFFVR